MSPRPITTLAIVALAAVASAQTTQAFNIDVHASPSMAPNNSFGGFPGLPGVWNSVPPDAVPMQLLTIAGAADNSDIRMLDNLGVPPGTAFNTTTGWPVDLIDLYEDYATSFSAYSVEIDDFEVGSYTAVVYSYAPNADAFFRIKVDGITVDDGIVLCPPMLPAAGYEHGESLTVLQFDVYDPGALIELEVLTEGFSALNGVQIFPAVGVSGCPQPPNSIGGEPEILVTGTIVNGGLSVAANDIVLNVGVLPGSLPPPGGSILCWVANDAQLTLNQGCPFVGVRCIGPTNFHRYRDPNAPSGSGGAGQATPFGTYRLEIDLNAVDLNNVNTSAGDKLFFQMVYRDGFDATCGTNVVRWTRSVEIDLVP